MSLSKVRMAPSRRPQQFSNWFRYCQEDEKKCQADWSSTTNKSPRGFYQSCECRPWPWALGTWADGQPGQQDWQNRPEAEKEEV